MLKQEASQIVRGSWAPLHVMQKSLLQGQGLCMSRQVPNLHCKTCGGTAGTCGLKARASAAQVPMHCLLPLTLLCCSCLRIQHRDSAICVAHTLASPYSCQAACPRSLQGAAAFSPQGEGCSSQEDTAAGWPLTEHPAQAAPGAGMGV